MNYPRGYVRSLVDVTLPDDAESAGRMEEKVTSIVSSAMEQFPGIVVAPPSVEGKLTTSSGKTLLRVKFRIWPGRGVPIETDLKRELIQTLKDIEPSYADWMVTVNYEVEQKTISLPSRVFRKKGK